MSDDRVGEIERGRLIAVGKPGTGGLDQMDAHDRLVENEHVSHFVHEVDVAFIDVVTLHYCKFRISRLSALEEFARRQERKSAAPPQSATHERRLRGLCRW